MFTPIKITKLEHFKADDFKTKEIIEEDYSELNPEELINIFYTTENITIKVKVLNKLVEIYPNNAYETITNLINTFIYMPSPTLYFLFEEIIKNSKIPLNLKIESVKCLYMKKEYKMKSYALFVWCLNQHYKKNYLNHLIEIDTIRYLLTSTEQEEDSKTYLQNFFNNDKIDINYRYKTLINITHDEDRKCLGRYLLFSYKIFLRNKKYPLYNILSSVWIFENSNLEEDKDECKNILNELCNYEKDEIKADAADMILKMITDELSRKLALSTILKLGGKTVLTNHIFGSEQNVHNSELNQSIIENCNKLASIHIPESTKFENVVEYLVSIAPNKEKITVSLLRIGMDSLRYPGSQTLKSIFLRVYTCINENENIRGELIKRLFEELEEMSNLCGSGHVSRLINVLSGFNLGFDMKIGIKAILKSRLFMLIQKRIEMIEDENKKDKILEQLSWDHTKDTDKIEWNEFIRENYEILYKTLKSENNIEEKEFDDYFKQIINNIETGIC